MYVADDGDGCRDVHDVGLAHEDLLCLLADLAEEGFMEELFAEELFYARVEVEWSHFGDANRPSCRAAPAVCLRVFGLVTYRKQIN